MSLQLTGTIQRVDIGMGVWTLTAEDGQTYELRNAPHGLLRAGLKVDVQGQVRTDIATTAMVGPVLQVSQCHVVD